MLAVVVVGSGGGVNSGGEKERGAGMIADGRTTTAPDYVRVSLSR